MIAGSMVALVTPMDAQGRLDWDSLSKLVDFHLQNGTNAIVAVGTTGESATLDVNEHIEVIRRVVDQVAGRIPVIAGTGANSTREAIELTTNAKTAGADACLLVTPYYNKPTQEGLYQHFLAIANAVELPIVVYNVPGRAGVNVEPATLRRLAEIDNIVGVKEASGNIAQIANLCATLPPDFAVLSGDDAITLAVAGLGGRGVISVASNVIPAEMAALAQACLDGRFEDARALQRKWLPLMEVNFVESNPIPVKWAMARMGLLSPVYRLPMVPPSQASRERIEQTLIESGLFSN